jgi:hypothetical protein
MNVALDTDCWTSIPGVAVLADGADGLKSLLNAVVSHEPLSRFDWLDISMRLRPVARMGSKFAALLGGVEPGAAATIRLKLPALRHQIRSGKFRAAMSRVRDIHPGTDRLAGADRPPGNDRVKRFRRHLVDLRDYMRNNWTSLTDYRNAQRNGLRIARAAAEFGMRRLVSQRVGKRQPTCSASGGAHPPVQVRCAVPDDRLDAPFSEWQPNLRRLPEVVELSAL